MWKPMIQPFASACHYKMGRNARLRWSSRVGRWRSYPYFYCLQRIWIAYLSVCPIYWPGLNRKLWGGLILPGLSRIHYLYKIARRHSLNYPPSFLFYLERLVRRLVYLPYYRESTSSLLVHVFTSGSSLQQPHLNNMLNASVESLQGRVWDGKESLLMALAKICDKCSKTLLDDEEQNKDLMDKVKT